MIKIKNLLIAAALVIASPALVFSQDIFLSFDSDSFLNTDTQDSGTGSAFLFSDGQFAFDALDLNFLTSDSSVLRFTGGEAFNPTFDIVGGSRFTSSEISFDPTTNTGNLFSVNILDNGVNPALGPLFDPGFNADVGPNGAVLLARLDFDIGGSGTTDIELSLGTNGAFQLPDVVLDPSLGNVSLTNSGLGPDVVFPPLPTPVDPPVNPPVDPPVNPPVDPPVNPPVDPPVDPPVYLDPPPINPQPDPGENPVSSNLFVSFDTDFQANDTSGTASIYSDGLFGFDALDLDITSSDPGVLLLTGGQALNPTFDVIGGERFDSSVFTVDADGSTGNLFSVNVAQNGVNPALGPLFDPGFDAEVGPNGAFLLAEVTFDIVGEGFADIELSLGDQGVIQFPDIVLDPSFGSASLGTFAGGGGGTPDPIIPEPSSAVLLLLGSAGMFAKRRKSLC